MQHYFQPIFERLRREPDDTLLSDLVNVVIPEWGRPLNDHELHAEIMSDGFGGGSETTTNALSAGVKLLAPAAIPQVDRLALWVALFTLVAKEGLFRYLLAVARRLRSSLLEVNAWHSRSDAASSLVVALGIGGNLLGYGLLDPIAALIVSLMVLKMGWEFLWKALNDLTDHAASEQEMQAIASDILATPGVLGVHDLRTRISGNQWFVQLHLELPGELTLSVAHAISDQAADAIHRAYPRAEVLVHADPQEVVKAARDQ